MEKTGIIRRIDNLGRIVIPKEIRKYLKISSNDPILFFAQDDKIVLSKSDSLEKDKVIINLLASINKILNKNIIITSLDKIIDYSLNKKMDLRYIYLKEDIYRIIRNRDEIVDKKRIFNDEKIYNIILSPLIIHGDLIGSLILFSDDSINNNDLNIIHFSKIFLEKYLE